MTDGRLAGPVRRLNGMALRVLAMAVWLAAGLLCPVAASAQAPAPPPPPPEAADLARIKRQLESPTLLRDAVEHAPAVPTFRTSVTQRIDIWKFWGDPDAVAAEVRPRSGSWHSEFQNMVTPDEVKGYGAGLGNGEAVQMVATSLAFALGMKHLTKAIAGALEGRGERKAKQEVQRELEAFYLLHPEARPAAPTPP